MMMYCIRISLFSQESGCKYVIKGRVLDSSHGSPLTHVEVEIIGQKNKRSNTDAEGQFIIDGLCAGQIELHISHEQCEHIHLHFQLLHDTSVTIVLKHIEQEFEGAKLSVKGEKQDKLSTISAKQLESRKGSSIASLMLDIGGVSLLKSGSNVSKPIVNGLHSNRVIIINNGIRQEGQNWGMEHAPEIDAFLANEIELLKGAESLRYASDGIGGVVLVKPSSIFRETAGLLRGELNIVGATNGRMGVISGFAGNKLSDKFPLYWRIQGTIKQGGNVKTPDYYLANTGVNEANYSANLAYKFKRLKTELFYSHFENKIGIFSGSHIGNLSDLQKAMNSDRPLISSGFTYDIKRPYQFVTHQLLKIKNDYLVNAQNSIEFIFSYQNNHRQEFDLLRSATAYAGPSFDYYIHTYMGDVVWVHNDFHRLSFKAGVFGMRQSNAYTGRFFIPGFYQKGLAAYFTANKSIGKMQYEAGIRYDIKQLEAYLWERSVLRINTLHFNNFTYVLQAYRQLGTRSKLGFLHSTSWRPPAPNELYANGLHQGLASIEIGDSSLRPERSFNQSLTYSLQKKSSSIEIEAYYQYINGFINLVPSLIPQLTIRGAFPVFKYEQNNAEIYGLNLMVKQDFKKYFFSKTTANILFGHNISNKHPLSQMPPLSGKTSLGFDNKKMSIQFTFQYTATQYRYVAGSDYKTPPKGYYLMGLELAFPFKIKRQDFKFNLSVSNLSNTRYRDYLNRFRYFADEQGFNLTARLIIPIHIQTNT